MGQLSPWHLLILAGVFILLFGARKLPEGARALGRSMNILRSETREFHGNDDVIEAPPSAISNAGSPHAGRPQQLTADTQTPGTSEKPDREAPQTQR